MLSEIEFLQNYGSSENVVIYVGGWHANNFKRLFGLDRNYIVTLPKRPTNRRGEYKCILFPLNYNFFNTLFIPMLGGKKSKQKIYVGRKSINNILHRHELNTYIPTSIWSKDN